MCLCCSGHAKGSETVDEFEFLVQLLVHVGVLDKKDDVDRWLVTIKEFSLARE